MFKRFKAWLSKCDFDITFTDYAISVFNDAGNGFTIGLFFFTIDRAGDVKRFHGYATKWKCDFCVEIRVHFH